MFLSRHLLVVFLPVSGCLADYLMGSHPAPMDLSSDESLVSIAWQNISSVFDDYLVHGNGSESLLGVENITFSAGIFSLHDPGAIGLQYHYTSPDVANAPNGTHEVDADTIYRAASVSKLITVMTGLLVLSEEDWNRPLAEIESIFRARGREDPLKDPIWRPQWDTITPWSLATQLSGLPTIGLPIDDKYATAVADPAYLQEYGAPPVDLSTLGICASKVLCNATESIDFVDRIPPNFMSWTNPSYSNLNFMILGMVIANITGKPIKQVYREALFDPLGMTSSNDTAPLDDASVARAAIPDWASYNLDALSSGFTIPSGGILSTTTDLQKLGTGILNNTLLSPAATRKWMKPVSHTSSLSYSIGAPWEIHRFVHPQTGRTTDLYTKLGDSGLYGGLLCIIPQYDAGFTFLATSLSATRGALDMVILDHITNVLVPALEAQAAAEARNNFVGTYRSTDPNLNASVTITFNSTAIPYISHSGLQISSWTYNGTDVINGPFFNGVLPRLQPSVAKQTPAGVPGQVAFQASTRLTLPSTLTYMDAMKIPELAEFMGPVIGPWTGFYNSHGDFALTDHARWGGVSANLIVFNVDAQGKATAVLPAVDRITLERVQGG